MKRFKTITEVYLTGDTYEYEEPQDDCGYKSIAEAYHLVNEGRGLSVEELNKVRSGQDRLAEFIRKLEDRESWVSAADAEENFGPFDYDREWLDQIKKSGRIVGSKIELADGTTFPLAKLAKTAEFGGQGTGTSKDTDIKEGLVTVFFAGNGFVDRVTKENYHAVRLKLKKILRDEVIHEEDKVKKKLLIYLGDKEDISPMAADLHELNQPLSQAATMQQSPYKNWTASRGKLFDKIRKRGHSITNFPADKWNPGDIYFINPELEDLVRDTLDLIDSEPEEEGNLKLLNDLFVLDWGDKDRPIVSISLKFADAQGGKAKDFLRTFLPAGTKDRPYNVNAADTQLTPDAISAEIMRLRSSITNHVNTKGSDVQMNFETQANTYELEENEKRLREKFASLKLVDFLFEQAGPGQLDDTIVAAVGFGMSLAGINPTFFKVVANKKGHAVDSPEKFTEKGMLALYPNVGEPDPFIYIKDWNTNNKVEIHCNVELEEEIKKVMLTARSNGGAQATLEIEKIAHVGDA